MAEQTGRPQQIRYATLWAGGLATAVVAALIAVAGVVVCRAVLDVTLLPASDRGVLGWSPDLSYPAGAAALALLATALLNLLLLGVPRPLTFFGWIMALVAVVVGAAPFAYDASTASQVATAVIGLVVVLATWSLLRATAARSVVRRTR